ncbi:MAG: shikimate dehydrogenase [Thermoguttaceae bacterium]
MMLCVLIACGSHNRMITEHASLAADGVKLVELRLDFLRKPPELPRLLGVRPSAALVTVRRPRDGGQWKDTEERRQVVLRNAIATGVEMVDLELDIAHGIPRFGKTRRLISYHNLEETPEDLGTLYAQMKACDPDIIKIAAMPKSIDDVHRLLRFVAACNSAPDKIPTVGISMGEMGMVSRILAGKYDMPITYATFSEARIIAPGLMYYKKLRDDFRCEKIDPDTAVFGIIGDPIGHSLSPAIHNASFAAAEMNAVYVPFRVSAENALRLIDVAADLGIHGLSVTIPHKQTVLETLTQQDTAVTSIGACNTIVFKDHDRIGYNTDYIAAMLAMERACGGRGGEEPSVLERRKAIVLGAGGAGRALAFGLARRGVITTVTDQDPDRAQQLAASLSVEWCAWAARHTVPVNTIVNCTPIGMHPNVNASPYERSSLRQEMLVFDAVYNPENTLLVKQAREKGCRVVTGVEMFVGQAMLQFRLFTGEKGSSQLMRAALKQALLEQHGKGD